MMQNNSLQTELRELSSNQLTIVQLKNMFIEENKEDRGMFIE